MYVRLPAKALFALAAGLIAVAAYLPGLKGGFALDDYTNVKDNPAIDIHDLSWDSLSHAMFSFQAGPAMRPISMLSFALNAYFTGVDDARPFKATNLCIHLVNSLLVMLLLSHLLAAWRRSTAATVDTKQLDRLAAITAALWLLHPLNAMPVLYVVQRETELSSLFVLLGLNLYVWARDRQASRGTAAWPIWIGVPLATAVAVLCKESGVLLPVYTLAVECFVFRFRRTDGGFDRALGLFYGLFLLLPGCLGLDWALLGRHGGALDYTGRDFSLVERLMTETRVVCLYIRWTLWPDPRTLGLYHDDIAVSQGLLHPATTLLSIVFLMGLAATAFLLRRRLPLVGLGIAWFLGGQLLESTIFPLELAYEHRCYLPDLGLLLAVTSLVLPLNDMAAWRLLRYALLTLMLASCATATSLRAADWSNNLSFAAAEAHHHPNSPYATYMLGQTYANLALMQDKGQYDNAVSSLKAASAVTNSSIIPDVSLVLVEAQIPPGKVEPGVLERIADKLGHRKVSASDIQGLSALGECVDNHNCELDPRQMQAVFDSALRNPNLAAERESHANILVIYGNFLASPPHRDLAGSRALMAQAVALVPTEPQYQMNLVTTDLSMGDKVQAEKDLEGLRKLNYLGHLDSQIAKFEEQISRLP